MVQVQTPPNAIPGQIIQVAVPSYTVPVAMATPAQQQLAPQQLQMQRTQGDAFNCAEAVVIKQEFNLVEVCGIEGKNYYRVHQSMADPSYRKTDGQQLLFVRERSECLERLCCGPQRTLTLFAHAGYDKNAPTYIQMRISKSNDNNGILNGRDSYKKIWARSESTLRDCCYPIL